MLKRIKFTQLLIAAFAVTLAFTSIAEANDFLIGKLEGIGFKVTRGNMTMTQNDLSIYEVSALVEAVGDAKIKMTINAKLQRTPGTLIKYDKRVDTFRIEWTGTNEGKLINTDATYKDDRSTFKIDGDELEIISWIARNQLTETQTYRAVK